MPVNSQWKRGKKNNYQHDDNKSTNMVGVRYKTYEIKYKTG